MSKIILDLCGGTGAWSKPYADAGYDVRLVTLPDHDVRTYPIPANVHGILAAPPCTEFSVAKANQPRDFRAGMVVVRACLEIIWMCRKRNKLAFWALENPRGFLRQFLGRPPFEFQQWEFGDMGVKPTDLWGYFQPPRKLVNERQDGLVKRYPNGKTNATNWAGKSAEIRAMTPPGFARAFFKANP